MSIQAWVTTILGVRFSACAVEDVETTHQKLRIGSNLVLDANVEEKSVLSRKGHYQAVFSDSDLIQVAREWCFNRKTRNEN